MLGLAVIQTMSGCAAGAALAGVRQRRQSRRPPGQPRQAQRGSDQLVDPQRQPPGARVAAAEPMRGLPPRRRAAGLRLAAASL